jgi:hypothetical protein
MCIDNKETYSWKPPGELEEDIKGEAVDRALWLFVLVL